VVISSPLEEVERQLTAFIGSNIDQRKRNKKVSVLPSSSKEVEDQLPPQLPAKIARIQY
jgi:hypothetical protein